VWPFGKKKDKWEGKDSIKQEDLNIMLRALAEEVHTDDSEYTRLPEKKMKALVYKYHNSHNDIPYKKDVTDCDDFALLARADMVRAMYEEKFELPVIFGDAKIILKNGVVHAVNWTVTSEGKFMAYDPQTQRWLNEKDYIAINRLRL